MSKKKKEVLEKNFVHTLKSKTTVEGRLVSTLGRRLDC